MAISTLDGVIAGMAPVQPWFKPAFTAEAAGQFHNWMSVAGIPAAVSLGSPGLAGATVSNSSSIGGTIPFSDPSGSNKAYIARLAASHASAVVSTTIFDCLWYNTGISCGQTTAQTINSIAWPARDTYQSSAGSQVEIWLWASATTGNGSAVTNTTLTYTNQSGAGTRTGTMPSFPATCAAGTMVPFTLQNGDTGVQSIQSLTLGTSYVSGTVNLMAIRRLVTAGTPSNNSAVSLDAFGTGLTTVHSGSALYGFFQASGVNAAGAVGEIQFTYG